MDRDSAVNNSSNPTIRQLIENAGLEQPLSVRLMCALQTAHHHSKGIMPLHPVRISAEDFMWIEEVGNAVIDNRARPPHPDPRIEEFLQNVFAA